VLFVLSDGIAAEIARGRTLATRLPGVCPMFQDKVVLSLFPTNVWAYDLKPEEAARLNADLVRDIEALISPRPELGPGETWQTDQFLHEKPAFRPFLNYAEEAARQALTFLKIRYEGFSVTGCWANINPPGTSHPGHLHPNNYLSGVYYPKVKSGAASITFNDPRIQTAIIAPHVTEVDQVNAVQAHLPVREGRILLFPSWMVHSVDVNRSDSERISIAFNIMFTQFAEKMAHPLWRSRFAKDGE
jgi:uncharacterized protein (TIGR02466 family)